MTITRSQVLNALARHRGQAKGARIDELVYEVTGRVGRGEYSERRVRALVSDLRADGHAVCAHPSTGYFIAETAEELERCCRFLRDRALHSLTLESRLRKIPLVELLGQLRLET